MGRRGPAAGIREEAAVRKIEMKVAIYARVSTLDKHQDPEVQLRELREYCERMGWQYQEYVDYASGAEESRPGYRRLIKDADRREFGMVLVWSLDRFGRSLRQLINDLEFFSSKRIDFRSHTQALDTTTPHGRLLFQVIASFAEFERSLISERVKAGLLAAQAKGKQLGRPSTLKETGVTLEYLVGLRSQGLSMRRIAKRTGVSKSVVHSALKNRRNNGGSGD